jgi:hypothetical protein
VSSTEYDPRRLSDEQIVSLLDLGRGLPGTSRALNELQRLVGLPPSELAQAVRDQLRANGVDVPDAARLLGCNELTFRRWLDTSAPLPVSARHKLAGLCVLLSLAADKSADSGAAGLVRSAVAAAGHESSPEATGRNTDPVQVLNAVFGPAGLMAAALNQALMAGACRADFSRED